MRRATGSIEWRGSAWHARVTLPDGKRPWIRLDGVPQHDRDRAQALAAAMAERVRSGSVTDAPGETVKEYAARWAQYRFAQARASAPDDESRLRNHVLPRWGNLAISSITKGHIEDLVSDLDRRVRADEIGWKTAGHIWGTVRTMFDDAARAKDRTLRAIERSPVVDVRGPERGAKPMRTVLRVDEFLDLVSCDAVPIARAQAYAVAIYLCLRIGELAALDLEDVHESADRPYVSVRQSIDRKRRPGVVGTTKGKRGRLIAIPRHIIPLLQAMRDGRRSGLLLPGLLRPGTAAEMLRADLHAASVRRIELHRGDAHRRAITFHDLRATGLTWLGARGDGAFAVREAAGHADLATTAGYVRMGEILGSSGEPFPALPTRLFNRPCNRPNVYKMPGFPGNIRGQDRGRTCDGRCVKPELYR